MKSLPSLAMVNDDVLEEMTQQTSLGHQRMARCFQRPAGKKIEGASQF